MSVAALAILGPIGAAILISLLRRFPAAIALLGSATGLLAAAITLARIEDGARLTATLPGLPAWPLRLVVDPLGAVFSIVVAVVSTFVLIYAVGYMADDDHKVRFFATMTFFAGAMQILVLAGDWILLLTAWELIGLSSYLLIGFWYTRAGVASAATRAFLVTRTADVGLYLGVIIVVMETGTTAIGGGIGVEGTTRTLAGLAFLLAAVGKSAQVPLQGWLQDAMVGPTPVSALLHAATLVVAGVVLLSRAFPLLPDGVLLAVGLVGGVSAVLMGLAAAAQRDLKRLLAASTSSQLGLMLLALGAGSIPAAVFHLITQAAMKSTLFLAAGVFQHDRESTAFDDLRGIGRQRPAVFAAFTLAGLALAGAPPLAGFWSKDAILVATMHSEYALLLAPLATFASALTGLYVGRACRLLWQGEGSSSHTTGTRASRTWMGTGLGVLAALATSLGLAAKPFARLLHTELPEEVAGVVIGLLAAALGLLVGWSVPAARLFGPTHQLVHTGFRLRGGWTSFVVQPALFLARRANLLDRAIHALVLSVGWRALTLALSSRDVDEGIHTGVRLVGRFSLGLAHAAQSMDRDRIDGAIRGVVTGTRNLGHQARQLQTGLVHQELLIAFGGMVALLILLLAA